MPGATWSTPVSLEPTAMVDNSYGVLAKGYNGRLYCMYNMNLDNVTKLPNGKSLGRTGAVTRAPAAATAGHTQ